MVAPNGKVYCTGSTTPSGPGPYVVHALDRSGPGGTTAGNAPSACGLRGMNTDLAEFPGNSGHHLCRDCLLILGYVPDPRDDTRYSVRR